MADQCKTCKGTGWISDLPTGDKNQQETVGEAHVKCGWCDGTGKR